MAINSRHLLLQHVSESTLNESQREELIVLLKSYRKEKNIQSFCNGLQIVFAGKFLQNKQLLFYIQKLLDENDRYDYGKFIKQIASSRRSSRVKSQSFEPNNLQRENGHVTNHVRSRTEPIILNASSSFENYNNNKTKYKQTKYLKDKNNILPSRKDFFPTKSKFKCVTLNQGDVGEHQDLGFAICGGVEKKSSIFISYVSPNSVAEKEGLQKGDCIVEINGTTLETLRLIEVAKIILTSNRLKLLLYNSNEMTDDVAFRTINPWSLQSAFPKNLNNGLVNGEGSDEEIPAELGTLRTVVISPDENHPNKIIGFNIRGGIEHGIGLFVTNIVKDTPADRSGLKVGDQIMEVNGESFEVMTNTEAVRFMKKQKRLAMKVVATGKIPEGKHMIEEYTWLTLNGERISSRPGSPLTPIEQRVDTSDTFYDFPDLPLDSYNSSNNSRPASPHQVHFTESTSQRPSTPMKNNINDKTRYSFRKKHRRKSSDELSQTSLTENYILQKSVSKYQTNDTKYQNKQRSRKESFENDVNNNSSARNSPLVKTKRLFKKSSSMDDIRNVETLSVTNLSTEKRYGSIGNLTGKRSLGEKVRNAFSWNRKRVHNRENRRNLFDSALFDKNDDKKIKQLDKQLQATLTVDEYRVVNAALKECLEKGDIDGFTEKLLNSIHTPGKHALIAEIRNTVFPYALGRNCTKEFEENNNNLEGSSKISVPITNHDYPENLEKPRSSSELQQRKKSGMHLKKNIFGFAKVPKKQVYEINKHERPINGMREDGRRYPANTLNESFDDGSSHDRLKKSSMLSSHQMLAAEHKTVDATDSFSEFLKPEPEENKLQNGRHKRNAFKRRSKSAYEIDDTAVSNLPNANRPENTKQSANVSRVRKSHSVGSLSFETPPTPRRFPMTIEQSGAYSYETVDDKPSNSRNIGESPYTSIRKNVQKSPRDVRATPRHRSDTAPSSSYEQEDFNPYTSVRRNTNQFPQEISLGDPYNPYTSVGSIRREFRRNRAYSSDRNDGDVIFDSKDYSYAYAHDYNKNPPPNSFHNPGIELYERRNSNSSYYSKTSSTSQPFPPPPDMMDFPGNNNDNYSTPIVPVSHSPIIHREPTYAQVNKNRKKSDVSVKPINSDFVSYDISLEKSPSVLVESVPLSTIRVNQTKRKEKRNAETQCDMDFEVEAENPYSTVFDNRTIPERDYNIDHQKDTSNNNNSLYAVVNRTRKTSNKQKIIRFSKGFQSLGLTISGGTSTRPDIRVAQVHPGTAAAKTEIKAGHVMVSLNGESLLEVTHNEAVQMFRKAFNDKLTPFIEVGVIDD